MSYTGAALQRSFFRPDFAIAETDSITEMGVQ